jgi:hypothetical protein
VRDKRKSKRGGSKGHALLYHTSTLTISVAKSGVASVLRIDPQTLTRFFFNGEGKNAQNVDMASSLVRFDCGISFFITWLDGKLEGLRVSN